MTGDEDYGQRLVDLLDRLQELDAIHARHTDIGYDDASKIAGEALQRALRLGEGGDLVPGQQKALDRRVAHVLVIVDEDHVGLRAQAAFSFCTSAGIATTNSAPPFCPRR